MLLFASVAIQVIQTQHPNFKHSVLIISLQNGEIINVWVSGVLFLWSGLLLINYRNAMMLPKYAILLLTCVLPQLLLLSVMRARSQT